MSKKITALYERSAASNPEHIRRQMTNLETYAEGHDFTNLRHYTDNGYSGFTTDRPAFSSLMDAVRAGEVGTIIVCNASRIAREWLMFDSLTGEFDHHGVRLICIMDKIDMLPSHIHDDENGLDYTLYGDYYLPDLLDRSREDRRPYGKWGMMRMDYLRDHRPGLFTSMLLSGQLHTHLADLDEQARERHELIVKQMAQTEGITEQLKMQDQMAWVGMMNNISAAADEIIMSELIFC